jgi:two-component system cell cycle sensor histidine kinase/response regulator CckA
MSAAIPFRRPVEASESSMHLLFGSAPLGIAQCTDRGVITAVNPAWQRMHGRGSETTPALRSTDLNFTDLSLTDLIPAEDRSESLRLFQEMVKGEREGFQLDHRLFKTDGSTAWIRWIAWRVPGSPGESACGLVMAEDITEHQHREQRLRQAEGLESVGRLAGGVAHDFNNLLTGVLLYCDLLLAGLDSGNSLRKYAEEIRGAGMQATGLVRQLLAVARPQDAAPQLLSLNTIAQEMRDLLGRLIGENIELCFHLDPNLGVVKMDTSGAQQILLNLILNARDAVTEGGRIVVETSNCKMQIFESMLGNHMGPALPCAMLVVSDNGKGMDADTQKRLFQAFFTTKSAGHGTGLGLALVHDIVTSAGGLIHVDSGPGCGTRITVLLPLVPEAALQLGAQEIANHAKPKIEGEYRQREEESIL